MNRLPPIVGCNIPATLTIIDGLDLDGAPEVLGTHSIKVAAVYKRGAVLTGERLELKDMSKFTFNGGIGTVESGELVCGGETWQVQAAKVTTNDDGSPHHTTLYCTP